MLSLPRTKVLALSLLALPALTACGPEPLDGEGDASESIYERLGELEDPADPDIEPTDQECQTWGAAAVCLDGASASYCGVIDLEKEVQVFGGCVPAEDIECVPGDVKSVALDCGTVDVSCVVDWQSGEPSWTEAFCESEGWDTPLVLRFDDAPVSMIAAEATPDASFDIAMAADGRSCTHTDWPSAATPWLAVDLDQSGTIDGGHELFGSGSRLADGSSAQNGFIALAAYDHNKDGVVDAQDPGFAELLLWRDHDADRLSNPGELETLAEAGVESLPLSYAVDERCDARGNCGVERADFRHAGGQGELVDIHLPCR